MFLEKAELLKKARSSQMSVFDGSGRLLRIERKGYHWIGLIQLTVFSALELYMKEVYSIRSEVTDILYNSAVYFQTFRFTPEIFLQFEVVNCLMLKSI